MGLGLPTINPYSLELIKGVLSFSYEKDRLDQVNSLFSGSIHTTFLAPWFRCFPGSLVLCLTPLMKVSPRPHSSVSRKKNTRLGGMVLNFSR